VPTLRQLLCASLASGLCFISGTAEARFGKRSSSSSSSSSSKGKVHDATPVGSSSDDEDEDGDSSDSSSSNTAESIVTLISFLSRSDPAPTYTAYASSSTYEEPKAEHRSEVMTRMGLEAQALSGGSALALNLGFEGRQWGLAGAMTSMLLPADDGTDTQDRIQLYSAHLTLALLSSERGRLRAEAGVAVAHAPDVTFVGPSIAMSFERCLFGGLDVEGRGQFVPAPHLQLDTQAGLGLHLGVLTLRGGWRWLLLDDRGHVDGESHRDRLTGPYVGLGLNF
jgi:hypothetical protein